MNEHTPMYVTNDGMGLATKPNSGTANVALLWILDCDRARDRAEWMARACNSHAGLLEACKAAVSAAERIIAICEDDHRKGDSANPCERSMPHAALAECYAATSFVTSARTEIAKATK